MTTRFLELVPKSLFGDEAIPVHLDGLEEISQPFEFFLNIASPNPAIKPEDILGQALAVQIDRDEDEPRYVHGYISHFWAGDFSESKDKKSAPSRQYRIRLVPWISFMLYASRSFVYLPEKLEKTVNDVLDEVIKRVESYGHVKTWINSNGAKILKSRKVEHCVQYRESDFNFLMRTLERYGIYYYFTHEKDKHTLVLSDMPNYPDCIESKVEFPVTSVSQQGDKGVILGWEHAYEFVPGKYEQTDYDFKQPSTDLKTKTSKHGRITLSNNKNYEMYDFPGSYTQKEDGESEIIRKLEKEEARFNRIDAKSNCRTFLPGHCFKLSKHHSCEDEIDKSYLITSIRHSATQPATFSGEGSEPTYSNFFTCVPKDSQYRPSPSARQPNLASIQTAVVVGPKGEEIYTDEFGRVKVQFHWDREGKRDENTSCWMRVAQVHAGKGFGGIDIPRVGEEVIVSFIEGDLDKPVVTGRLYHKESMPPFGLPDSKTISGIKTKTYKGKGYNEMSMDDTPGKEKINVHAQYDMVTTVKHDHTVKIETGNHKFDVDTGTASITVKGAVTEVFHATQSTTVQDTIDIKTNASFIHVTSPTEIKLSVGSSTLTLTPDTITLNSPNIVLEAPTQIKATSPLIQHVADSEAKVSAPKVTISGTQTAELGVGSQTVKCDTSQVGVSGAAINSSATGQHDITGAIVKIN